MTGDLMSGLHDANVRRFYRAALQRLKEAMHLLEHGYTTAAVYLGGYAIECMLKCLLCARTPRGERRRLISSFRGQGAHSLVRLRQALTHRGLNFPPPVTRQIVSISWWSTDLRYEPGELPRSHARQFLSTVEQLVGWGKGGL